jgi:RNA polymerase sigma-70 factor (ECF subfamily)
VKKTKDKTATNEFPPASARNEPVDIDQILVIKAQKGDMEAFEALIKKYEKKIYNISYRMLQDGEEALDAAQDVFLKVYRSLSSFKSESKFSTWLYRVTTNVCLDLLRKRKDKNNISLDAEIEFGDGQVKLDPASPTPGIEEEIERGELKKLVSKAVGELPEIHQSIIVLRDIQDLSYSEIARILDCPEGTIKSRISRARKALKALITGKKELSGYIGV